MSSLVRSRSQIDVRTKFLLTVATTTLRIVISPVSAVMKEVAFVNATQPVDPGVGCILRDLGKSVTTIDSTGHHSQVWRLVQDITGGHSSEGIQLNEPTWYVRVWAANPATNPVTVVRFG